MCVCSLRYPARIAHAPYCHLWPVRLYNIFPHYITNRKLKKVTEQNVCFVFSINTPLILRRNGRDVIINVYWSYCKVSSIIVSFYLNKNFLDILSKNIQTSNSIRNRPVGAELIHADGEMDGQT